MNEVAALEAELKAAMQALEAQRLLTTALLTASGAAGHCRGCGAKIYWMKHTNGKSAPYNLDGLNHFATCPQADKFKKGKISDGNTAA